MGPAATGPTMAGRDDSIAETGDGWPDGEMVQSQGSEISRREK